MEDTSRSTLWVYVDESIHDSLGYIVTAFLFSKTDLDDEVTEGLMAAGLTPGRDEYKSGRHMANSPQLRAARDAMLFVARGTRVALLVSPSADRQSLGESVMSALHRCIRVNDIRADRLLVFFDRDLVRPPAQAHEAGAALRTVPGCELHFDQDSRAVLGLQAADFAAHAMAQVLREELGQLHKQVPLGEDAGYEEGTEASLGWILRVWFRHSFFTHRVAVSDDGDLDEALHPDLLGWGVFLDRALSHEVATAAERVFANIWLGCLH